MLIPENHLRPSRPADVRPVNVDGKGASGFMLDWYSSEPRAVVSKPARQVLAEFFTSMLVLSARFKYKPAPGVSNYLYFADGHWVLSLIAPDEWSEARRAGFAGTCTLQADMTWTIVPSEKLTEAGPVSDALGRFHDAFAGMLDTDLTLEEVLPYHVRELPYYQRLFANALARSVEAAVVLGGQREIRCRDWRRSLPSPDRALLPADA